MWRDIISVIFDHIYYIIFPRNWQLASIKGPRATLPGPVNTLTRSREGPGFLIAIRRLSISPANSDTSVLSTNVGPVITKM